MRVLTWNLWWRFGDWRARRPAIRAVLREVQPDICCLQEVWADADENLADDLGLSWSWGPAGDQARWQNRIGDPTVQFGVALLSRWPIVDPRYEDLPADTGRPMLSAVVDDAWAFAEPAERGFTWDRRNPYVALAPDPSGRIDYLTVGQRYDLTVGRVRSVRLVATGPVQGVWASDHAAIAAELSDS